MSDNNVVQFPGGMTQEEIEKKQAEGMRKVVETVEKRRKEGLENLERYLARTKSMRKAGRSGDSLLEELETAVNGALMSLEAINQFCDMMKNDLVGLVHNLENQALGGYSTSLHLEALLNVLLEKGAVTDEEMKESFVVAQKRMKEQMEKGPTQDPSQ